MKLIGIALFLITNFAYAWDYGAKFDVQESKTNNVNLTSSAPIKDTYNTLTSYVQAKNDTWKYRFKLKSEKYKDQNSNDSSSGELSVQYKRTKMNDFSLAIFKQSYPNTPVVNNDTASDNQGASLSTTMRKDFDKETNGYLTLSASSKKYPKTTNRTDTNLSINPGIEHNVESHFLFNPEFSYQNNSSSNSYYSSTAFGPSVLLSYTPNDQWEIFSDGSYTYTHYSNRPYTPTVPVGKKALPSEAEHQGLLGFDFGITYNFPKWVSIQGKYAKSSNTSNNPTSAYKADVVSIDLSLRI